MHPYSRQTINQLLAEMDGFKPNEGVIIIGATNFPEALDNALIRPGRFDMQVTVPRPDVKGRTEILKWYLNKIKFDQSVDPEIIARGTVGFSGAELENLVNQAALKAAVDGKEMVTMKELEFSKDKILMGPERRSVEIDNKNKTITAYHESGHAIIAYYTKDAMPINKATIMPWDQHLDTCPCYLRMTDGMKLEPSCLHKWMLVWEEEWQRSLYLELTILQQVLPVILIMPLK